MHKWVEQTHCRAQACSQAGNSTPQRIPPKANELDNHAMTQMCDAVKQTGFAHYAWRYSPSDPYDDVAGLLNRLSLTDADQGVIRERGELSLLRDLSGSPKGRFPAYRASAMNWHTDGYYNAPDDAVRCFTLHCVEPASEGGALTLMDDAFLVLALLLEDPLLVALLSHPQAMTLPQNRDDLGHDRTDPIQWRCDATKRAATRAVELINLNPNWHIPLRLNKGEGVITRNVLHARAAFVDSTDHPKRLMLRGRFNTLPQPTAKQGVYPMADPTHALR